eukprot:scaffold3056_cov378-Prasinococcus_capsulatus_cf.AAC.2
MLTYVNSSSDCRRSPCLAPGVRAPVWRKKARASPFRAEWGRGHHSTCKEGWQAQLRSCATVPCRAVGLGVAWSAQPARKGREGAASSCRAVAQTCGARGRQTPRLRFSHCAPPPLPDPPFARGAGATVVRSGTKRRRVTRARERGWQCAARARRTFPTKARPSAAGPDVARILVQTATQVAGGSSPRRQMLQLEVDAAPVVIPSGSWILP